MFSFISDFHQRQHQDGKDDYHTGLVQSPAKVTLNQSLNYPSRGWLTAVGG
jgi:hypothetical protein